MEGAHTADIEDGSCQTGWILLFCAPFWCTYSAGALGRCQLFCCRLSPFDIQGLKPTDKRKSCHRLNKGPVDLTFHQFPQIADALLAFLEYRISVVFQRKSIIQDSAQVLGRLHYFNLLTVDNRAKRRANL